MKIDMAKATIEWLEAWRAEQAKNPALSFYNRRPVSEVEAKRRYLAEKLCVYIHDEFQVSDNRVTLYTSDLNRETISKLMRTKIILPGGEALLAQIEADSYYEPYDPEPSRRLELTFSTNK